jgi:ATP-dependent DNA ligase
MSLPIQPPFPPMEALLVDEVPSAGQWQYEPKWDGFRCLVFRDGKSVYLQSKSGQPLGRYFPELLELFGALKTARFVLDGEIAIPVEGHFSFDDLLQRIHPAESRVRKLAREFPAIFIAFDLLVGPDGKSLVKRGLRERRPKLEAFARKFFAANEQLRLSPATTDLRQARAWLEGAGGNLDGIIAKRLDCEYKSGERTGMEKIKKLRTADCVVGGFRYAEKREVVGSLLLGLYDEQGLLDHVGFCSGIKEPERKALTARLEKLIEPPGFTGRAPGGLSRWSTRRSMEWQPLRPELVVEVSYDHFTGGRFRHGTRLLRWRPDKKPRQCTFEQVEAGPAITLELLKAA